MKIVQYMLGFRNADGGVVRAVIDLCNMLASARHELVILTTDASDAPRDWNGREGRPLLITLPAHRLGQGLLTRESLQVAAESLRGAQVLHLHVPWDLICVQLGRVARRSGTPYIVTVHGMLDDWTMRSRGLKKKAYLALGGRRMLERAAAVQCCSRVEMEQSAKWYPRGRSAVAPLPFDLSRFARLPGPEGARTGMLKGVPAGQPLLLMMGRLHPIKRTELLLEAVAELKKSGVTVQVALTGTGEPLYEQSLRGTARDLSLADQAHFLGFVSGSDKLSLYQAADLLVHPSAHESFGLGMVEALAAGLPVLTTKAVNIWPELQDGGGAMIVDDTAPALAAGLRSLALDPTARRDMGKRGREWAFKFLEPRHVLGQYEAMYRDAIVGRGHA